MADSISTKNPATQTATVAKTNTTAVKPKNPKAEVMLMLAKAQGARQTEWQKFENEFLGTSSTWDKLSQGYKDTLSENIETTNKYGPVSQEALESQNYFKQAERIGRYLTPTSPTVKFINDELYPQYFKRLDELYEAVNQGADPVEVKKYFGKLELELDKTLAEAYSQTGDELIGLRNTVGGLLIMTPVAIMAPQFFIKAAADGFAASTLATQAVVAGSVTFGAGQVVRSLSGDELAISNAIDEGWKSGNWNNLENALKQAGVETLQGASQPVFGAVAGKVFNSSLAFALGLKGLNGMPLLSAGAAQIFASTASSAFSGGGISALTALYKYTEIYYSALTEEQKIEKMYAVRGEFFTNVAFSAFFGGAFGAGSALASKFKSDQQLKLIDYLLKQQSKTGNEIVGIDNRLFQLEQKIKTGEVLSPEETAELFKAFGKHIGSASKNNAPVEELITISEDSGIAKLLTTEQKKQFLALLEQYANNQAGSKDATYNAAKLLFNPSAPAPALVKVPPAPTAPLQAVSQPAITTAKPVLPKANPLTLVTPLNAPKPITNENNIVPFKAPKAPKIYNHVQSVLADLSTQQQLELNKLLPASRERFAGIIQGAIDDQMPINEKVINGALEVSKRGAAVLSQPKEGNKVASDMKGMMAGGSNLNSWEVQNTLSLTGEEVVLGELTIKKILSNPNQTNYRVAVNNNANEYTIVQVSSSAEANAQAIPQEFILEGKKYEITFTADKITLKELPVTATPPTQAQPVTGTVINPVRTKIDASNVSIRNDGDTVLIGGTQRVITFADLESFGLVPKHEAIIKISGTNHIILFSNPVKLGTRTGFVIYFQDPITKEWIPRPSYRSASHGIIQIPHGIERLPDGNTNWFGKGIIPNSKSATAVPTEIDEVLAELEKTQQILDKPEIKQVVCGLAKNTIPAPIPVHPNNKPFSQVLNHKAIDLQKQYPTLEINIIAPNFGSMKIPQALKPNFEKAEHTYTSSNPVYGELQVETYLSNDGKYLWTMLKQISTNRVWVGGLNSTSSPLETTGLLKEIPDIGLNLSTAPLEYTVMMKKWDGMEQNFIDEFGQEYNQKYMTFEEAENSNSYRDVWSLVKENPVIQDYYKAKGITEKLPEIKPKDYFTVRNATLQKVSNPATEAESLHDLVNNKPNNLTSVPINLPVVGGMFTGRILKLFVNGKELILTAYFDSLTSAKASLIGVKNTKTDKEFFVTGSITINGQITQLDQTVLPTGTVINPANQAPAQTVGTSTNKTAVASSIITPVENKAIPVIQKRIKYNLKTNVSPNSPVEGNSDIQKLQNAPVVTIGDLHANPRKLIETLVMSNLVTMTEQKADQLIKLFKELDAITYEGYLYSDDNLVKVKKIYSKIQAIIKDIEWIGGDRQLLLLGDEIADRGHFDQVVMDLIQHINGGNANSKIIVIASNHSYVGRNFNALSVIGRSGSSQARSFQVSDNPEALKARYTEHIANQKLMVYNPKTKTLYAHAMITPANIKQLIVEMQKFGYLPAGVTKYEDINENNLASFIDKANEFYHDYILEIGNFAGKDLSAVDEIFQERGEGRVGGLVWGEDPYENVLQLPFHNKGVSTLVHGHGDKSKSSPYEISNNNPDFTIVNLNQQIGKGSNTGAGQDNPLFVENDLIDLPPATVSPPTTSNQTQILTPATTYEYKEAKEKLIDRIATLTRSQLARDLKIGLGVGAGGLAFTGALLLIRMIKNNEINPGELNKLSDGELNALMVALTEGQGGLPKPALIMNGSLFRGDKTGELTINNKKISVSVIAGKYNSISGVESLTDPELDLLMVALSEGQGELPKPALIMNGSLFRGDKTGELTINNKKISVSVMAGKYNSISIN